MASTSSTTTIIKALSITIALLSSGSIATLSAFDIPLLKSQPASRSLPSTRWLFSRGSHIFPTASVLSSSGFIYLAYKSLSSPLPSTIITTHKTATTTTITTILQSLFRLVKVGSNGRIVNGYLLAAILVAGIGPWTSMVMVPSVNFRLIELNEMKGGSRSSESAALKRKGTEKENESESGSKQMESGDMRAGYDVALDSVNGKGQANQFTDLSGPQTQTEVLSTEAEDEEVRGLLGRFAALNAVRAVLIGSGGILGLVIALAA